MLLESVAKRYGPRRWVLMDVDLMVSPGEAIAVAGSNGSGKSTLLRILAGLTRPSRGSVSGRPAVVGYVPERFPPSDRLTATAYLTHLGRVRGLTGGAAAARADALLRRLALADAATTPIRNLSKGNAQKVALAQALLVPPELLILDEPWSGLDASAHGVLGDIIGEVLADGGSVVFTDHREAITPVYASRGVAIVDGRLHDRAVDYVARAAEVRLAASPDPSDVRDVEWHRVPGVRHVRPGPRGADDEVAIDVDDAACDALLGTALAHGWSIRDVTRYPGRPAVPEETSRTGTR